MKRPLIILLVLLLVASTANLVVAIVRYLPFSVRYPLGSSKNLSGAAAAAHRWPGLTPHPRPWPVISAWQEERGFARIRINAYGAASADETFAMLVDRTGWPLPVRQHTERWWPWDHPNWKMAPNVQDAGFTLLLPGLILNPIIAALTLWLPAVLALWGWRYYRLKTRRGKDQCPDCGYPIGVSEVCTECGAVLPVPTTAAAR